VGYLFTLNVEECKEYKGEVSGKLFFLQIFPIACRGVTGVLPVSFENTNKTQKFIMRLHFLIISWLRRLIFWFGVLCFFQLFLPAREHNPNTANGCIF